MYKPVRILTLFLALIMVCSMTALAIEPDPRTIESCPHDYIISSSVETKYVTDDLHEVFNVVHETCRLCGDHIMYYYSQGYEAHNGATCATCK